MSSTLFGLSSLGGVDVNGVIYRYTAVKDPNDPFTVTIQNENADGNGYIFRETDDWTGQAGNTINKFKTFDNSPISNWGDGSIATTGVGSVVNPVVLYSYRQTVQPVELIEVPEVSAVEEATIEMVEAEVVSTTESSHFDPVEPNTSQTQASATTQYIPEIVSVISYDILSDELVQIATSPTASAFYEYNEQEPVIEEDDKRKENVMYEAENALASAAGIEQGMLIRQMTQPTDISSYYSVSIDGGTYRDSVKLVDGVLPDNRRAFSSMSRDSVHTDMVNQQYGR